MYFIEGKYTKNLQQKSKYCKFKRHINKKRKAPFQVLDFHIAKYNTRFMVNKLKLNPNIGLNIAGSESSNLDQMMLTISKYSDLTTGEKTTLLIFVKEPKEESRKDLIKAFIGDYSTWWRNLKRLANKGYLVQKDYTNE